jgi:nitrilase
MNVKVAAVQATPVFLDRDATIDKAIGLVKEAAAEGAQLIVFPETFVPTYPDWVWRATPWSNGDAWYRAFYENSVEVPSPATDALAEAVRDSGAYVAMGISERERNGGTLYNSLVYFAPDGSILGTHRKLMPTGGERLVWGMGDGSTLHVFDTPFGRLGGLICWENYMPLARAAMYAQGVDVWVAPTWDNSETWVATLRHIAKEGRTHVIGAAPCLRGSDVPASVPDRDNLYKGDDDWMSRGFSTIVAPDGSILAGPLVETEGILYADIDTSAGRAARYEFDPTGHYARPDVFTLKVDTTKRSSVSFDGE